MMPVSAVAPKVTLAAEDEVMTDAAIPAKNVNSVKELGKDDARIPPARNLRLRRDLNWIVDKRADARAAFVVVCPEFVLTRREEVCRHSMPGDLAVALVAVLQDATGYALPAKPRVHCDCGRQAGVLFNFHPPLGVCRGACRQGEKQDGERGSHLREAQYGP